MHGPGTAASGRPSWGMAQSDRMVARSSVTDGQYKRRQSSARTKRSGQHLRRRLQVHFAHRLGAPVKSRDGVRAAQRFPGVLLEAPQALAALVLARRVARWGAVLPLVELLHLGGHGLEPRPLDAVLQLRQPRVALLLLGPEDLHELCVHRPRALIVGRLDQRPPVCARHGHLRRGAFVRRAELLQEAARDPDAESIGALGDRRLRR
mmetsp:Transcript_18889/g.63297  ORF Transcript_18889/g.63297 Transcript_18889/m.63297 type:complete len:207 (-) Transcript_18889:41-661(-)